MRRSLLAAAALLSTLSVLPTASWGVEEGPESPAPFNVSLTSEYRYRGISQSRFKPALQGGYDYSSPNGLYLGTWLSTIKGVQDAGGDARVEWDLYGGYKGALTSDVGYDVGGLYYEYPRNGLNPSANTFEIYGALTYGVFTAKYSHSVTNLFGFASSKNSGYLDLSATFDAGDGWSVLPHVGHQAVAKFSKASYTDYSLIVGKDVSKGVNLSAGVYGTNANKSTYVAPDGKFLGRTALVATIKFNF
jgi:uncharacterized protein (TIGR02001 family)